VLDFHKDSVYAVAFAPISTKALGRRSVLEQGEDRDGEGRVRAWLAVGGKDERISLWEMYPVAQDG
jgi:hypothetical protein